MEKLTNNNELLRDVYASQLLVSRAKQAGFTAEPAVLNLATDEEYYTLAVMQKWLREQQQLNVYCIPAFNQVNWCAKVSDNNTIMLPSNVETFFADTYEEALEAGLNHAFALLIKRS